MMNEGEQYDIAVDAIMSGTERLFSSMGNTQEMVKQAKILAEATSSLVNAIKLEAENETDPGKGREKVSSAHLTRQLYLSFGLTSVSLTVAHPGAGD